MTESEFQEFMITMGYRYNEKAKTAFNSFEGFRNLVDFNEKESRYSLRLDCTIKQGEDISEVSERLEKFRIEHKNNVLKAVFRKRLISITLKMTIDSELDKEKLRGLVRLMTELCKSGKLVPICHICARDRKTGLYVVGKEVTAVCDSCIARKRRQYEKRKDLFIKKKQNMPAGLIGAVFGAAFGAMIHILLYQLFPVYGTGSLFIISLTFIGFVITGHRATKKSGVICAFISVVAFLAAEYVAMILNTAIMIEREGGGIALSESIYITNSSFEDTANLWALVPELSIGVSIIIVVGIVYLLKRKYTRPMKISKNIL